MLYTKKVIDLHDTMEMLREGKFQQASFIKLSVACLKACLHSICLERALCWRQWNIIAIDPLTCSLPFEINHFEFSLEINMVLTSAYNSLCWTATVLEVLSRMPTVSEHWADCVQKSPSIHLFVISLRLQNSVGVNHHFARSRDKSLVQVVKNSNK